MLIIPAIDLKDGVCVRLEQGRKDAVTVYSRDAAGTAKKWEGMGARPTAGGSYPEALS